MKLLITRIVLSSDTVNITEIVLFSTIENMLELYYSQPYAGIEISSTTVNILELYYHQLQRIFCIILNQMNNHVSEISSFVFFTFYYQDKMIQKNANVSD